MSAALSETRRPRLASRFSHAIMGMGSAVLVTDDDSVVLTGDAIGDFVALLDGTRSASEIAQLLGPPHGPDVVNAALARLESRSVLAQGEGEYEGVADPPPDLTLDASARRIREAWLQRGDRELASMVLPSESAFGALSLLITDDYLRPAVVERATEAYVRGTPLLFARIGRESAWLGPLVRPGVSACLACLVERLRANLPAHALVRSRARPTADGYEVRPVPASSDARVGDLLAGLLAEAQGRPLAELCNQVAVRRVGGDHTETHVVQWLPGCRQCGSAAAATRRHEIHLRRRRKVAGSGGGFRIDTPANTLRRYEHLVDPLTGVVRFLERVPTGADCVHVYTANHAGTATPSSLKAVQSHHRDSSGGKGSTDLDARVSALGEALERTSAIYRATDTSRLACLDEMGDSAIKPNDLLLLSERQYEDRREWNRLHGDGFQFVPEAYEGHERILWTPVRSLVTDEVRHVPTAAIHLGFEGPGSRFVRGDSNGLAGGNCLEEAILQGFLELVERDAVALWWYNRLTRPGVDVANAADPYIDRVAEHHASLGRSLWALDLTTDLGIPCFAALSARRDTAAPDIIFGFGAHLDARIALRRAVTELNQMLPTVLRSPAERAKQLLPDFRDAIRWWETATLERHAYLSPDPSHREVAVRHESVAPTSDDLSIDLEWCIARMRRLGLDLLVYDLTRADIGLSVARVLVPGLRHFWRRLGPGRLYDTPVTLGWLAEPTSEEAMNPISMFV